MTESTATGSETCFLGARPADASREGIETALVALPWDGSVTYRGGASQGPAAIRAASDSIESYCPILDRDLEAAPFIDQGNLDVGASDMAMNDRVKLWLDQVNTLADVPTVALGGDHLAAYPFLAKALKRYSDLQIFHIDAHTDLRESWDGEAFNHATVLHRALDKMSSKQHLHQWGIRSGLKSEFELAKTDERITLIQNDLQGGLDLLETLRTAGKPVYITFDVDGLDPSDIPGTGTPEPGGLGFRDVERVLTDLAGVGVPVVGADLVELAPNLDPTGRSSVAGARLVRTMLLLLRESNR